ncbi:MAG TPA: DNA mismatch repair endonuclease MutL [Crocinitomicaceae bacterium]|nr:DNA mismatch repair endonuclease MutL [Crocinitomicaceae bacterium]
MEQLIKLLPEHICNQIAAGEVIQRPASVVKELVENAIDAGATAIDVYIKQAGKALIQVVDNGKGMSLVDTKMAFERHATSKITNVDDLFALQTKGFRGEALASIASISHVTLKTKRPTDEVGVELVNEGGKIKSQESVVCKDGTSFEIKNLFYNVPARRNFLKSDAVEFGHIEEEFLRVALIHESIAFSLHHNDKPIYQLPSSNARQRIVAIYGKAMNDKLVPVFTDTDIVKIDGFIGKPEFAKKTRGEQYFFVNNRFFKDAYLHNALSGAFEGLIPSGTFPGYFLRLEIDPARIDVNVHPTKTEIKFEHHKEIYVILKTAVKEALGKFNVFPTLDFERETAFDLPYDMKYKPIVEPQIKVDPTYNPFHTTKPSGAMKTKAESDYANKTLQSFGFERQQMNAETWQDFYSITDENETAQTQLIESESTEIDLSTAFLVRNMAFVPNNEQLWVVDLNRANERLIFDELFATFLVQNIAAQRLLFPMEFEISHAEQLLWQENEKTISRLGFEWDIQNNVLELISVPALVSADVILNVINDIRESLVNEHFEKSELAHILISTIAKSSGQQKKWNKDSMLLTLEKLTQSNELTTPSGNQISKWWSLSDFVR